MTAHVRERVPLPASDEREVLWRTGPDQDRLAVATGALPANLHHAECGLSFEPDPMPEGSNDVMSAPPFAAPFEAAALTSMGPAASWAGAEMHDFALLSSGYLSIAASATTALLAADAGIDVLTTPPGTDRDGLKVTIAVP